MRSHPGSFELAFLLPRPAPGRCYAGLVRGLVEAEKGCSIQLEVPSVRVTGSSREHVFEAATAFLRRIDFGDAISIGAILHTPKCPSGFDRWQIVVGADVAFTASGIEPWLPGLPVA